LDNDFLELIKIRRLYTIKIVIVLHIIWSSYSY